ncbi:hypothetical protein Tco_0813700, partial [Tanacetum coccineum]
MDEFNITMEEYIHLEVEKACRREFPAIVYNDALTSKPEVSPEPTVSPNNDKDFDFEISFLESDDEDYTFTYDKNSFSYKLIYVNDLKPNSRDDNNKINVELSLENINIKPLDSVIDANIDTHSHKFDENFEMSHNIPSKSFTIKGFVITINVIIRTRCNEGKPLIFIIKNVYVPFGNPFDPKWLYKDGAYTKIAEAKILHNYLLDIRDTGGSDTRDRSTLMRSFKTSRR